MIRPGFPIVGVSGWGAPHAPLPPPPSYKFFQKPLIPGYPTHFKLGFTLFIKFFKHIYFL